MSVLGSMLGAVPLVLALATSRWCSNAEKEAGMSDELDIAPELWAEIERRFRVAAAFAAEAGDVLGGSWRVEHTPMCPANDDESECTCGCLAWFVGIRSMVCVDVKSGCFSYPLH